MKKILKRVLIGLLVVIVLAGGGFGIFVYAQVSAFDSSMAKVYDVPVPPLTRSSDPAVLTRGKHIAEAVAGCASADCHGPDLGGGKSLVMGPLGTLTAPNLTSKGLGAVYSDGELARVIRHGIKKDGRSALFMPAQEFNWLSENDLTALVSYIRSVPPVDRPNGPVEFKTLGKVLDRQGKFAADIARRIDHNKIETAGSPVGNEQYGRFLIRVCTGCHGEHLSGGPIPGAPASIPTPVNITPHESGIKGWTYEDFDKLLVTGMRKNGKQVNPFMPVADLGKMDEIEKRALYAYMMAQPPRPFGGR